MIQTFLTRILLFTTLLTTTTITTMEDLVLNTLRYQRFAKATAEQLNSIIASHLMTQSVTFLDLYQRIQIALANLHRSGLISKKNTTYSLTMLAYM